MSKNPSKGLSSSKDTDSLSRLIKQPSPAPVHLWDPPYCGEMDMRIARDGTWYHQGRPIRRLAMVQLFSSVLKKENDKFYLVTPVEKVGIRVDDCPFVAQSLDTDGQKEARRLLFTLNTKEQIVADKAHAIIVEEDPDSGEPHPMIHVRNGLNALLARSVFYQLVELADGQPSGGGDLIRVRSAGCFFQLGTGHL